MENKQRVVKEVIDTIYKPIHVHQLYLLRLRAFEDLCQGTSWST